MQVACTPGLIKHTTLFGTGTSDTPCLEAEVRQIHCHLSEKVYIH